MLFVDRVEPEAPSQVAWHQVRTLRLPPTLALGDVVQALQEQRQRPAEVGDDELDVWITQRQARQDQPRHGDGVFEARSQHPGHAEYVTVGTSAGAPWMDE